MRQFDIYIATLDPTKGSEIKNTRPCLIISPDEMNNALKTVLVAPLTSTQKAYPSRVNIFFNEQDGAVALDQIRALDKSRLLKKAGTLNQHEAALALRTLQRIFA